MSTLRILFLLSVSFVFIVFGALTVPVRSRATAPAPQQTTSRKQSRGQLFVPGEIIVRYRSESMARGRIGTMRITARNGQLRSMRVDDF
jgi:hypothetical protein